MNIHKTTIAAPSALDQRANLNAMACIELLQPTPLAVSGQILASFAKRPDGRADTLADPANICPLFRKDGVFRVQTFRTGE